MTPDTPQSLPTHCRLCQATPLQFLYIANQETILKCPACGFMQVAYQPSATRLESLYQASYFGHSKYRDHETLQREYKRRINLMKRHLPSSECKVLEVGCAAGDFIQLAKQDFDMYGFDLSDFAAQKAKALNPDIADHIWSGKLEDQVSQGDLFDAVLVWDTIEHIWDPLSSAKQLLEYIRPNGFLFISTPAADALTTKLMGKYWHFMTPPEHLSFFTYRSLEVLFQETLGVPMIEHHRWGKWSNLGFILYKIRRVAPFLMPTFVLNLFEHKWLKSLAIYVPTNDVQYVVIQKKGLS